MIEAKVILDSVSPAGKRITTLQLKYHRFIHSEFMTHRAFSRNSMSSRAVPVAKMIEQVRNDPAMPVHWGKNQPGMQARDDLTGEALINAQMAWRGAAAKAADSAQLMMDNGLAKQVANRILEPFQWMHTVVTATEWDNFFALRCHPDAQPVAGLGGGRADHRTRADQHMLQLAHLAGAKMARPLAELFGNGR